MARRVVSVLRGPAGAARASEPALEANAYAVAEDVDLVLVLRRAGLELAIVRGEVPSETVAGVGLPPYAAGQDLRGLIESGVGVYALDADMATLGLDAGDLVEGLRVVDAAAYSRLLRDADAVLWW